MLYNDLFKRHEFLCQRDQHTALILLRLPEVLQVSGRTFSLSALLEGIPKREDLPACTLGMGCTLGQTHCEMQFRALPGQLSNPIDGHLNPAAGVFVPGSGAVSGDDADASVADSNADAANSGTGTAPASIKRQHPEDSEQDQEPNKRVRLAKE
ncbi:hypothetical protein HYQ46_011039 [Verticillium longisporum]|nr:hypothetical protein HYQ46_011039 [Verticillium longisporum]